LISQAEREVLTYLDEVRTAADPDLWAEVSAKLNDCLIVYRRHLERLARSAKAIDPRIRIPASDMNELVEVYRREIEDRRCRISVNEMIEEAIIQVFSEPDAAEAGPLACGRQDWAMPPDWALDDDVN
jgi:hypothetical protein